MELTSRVNAEGEDPVCSRADVLLHAVDLVKKLLDMDRGRQHLHLDGPE